ncbi:MAG: hypothetical protein ABEH56_01395 [Salinirussus sp.]
MEWRRYTATPRPQLAWSGLVALGLALGLAVGGAGSPPVLAGLVGAWLVGLVAFGWRERRYWHQIVAASSFERRGDPGRADLQRLVRGHTVTVTTDLVGPLGGSTTTVSTPVTGVDATFTVRATTDGDGTDGAGTGDANFDSRYAVRGTERNVELVLSPEVRIALLELPTPGTVTASDSAVTYEVPFTRLTPAELSAAAEAVVIVAERVEAVGGD